MWNEVVVKMLIKGIFESLYMTLFSSIIAYAIGLPLGIVLVVTDKDGISPCIMVNRVLGVIINLIRSIPFIVLLLYLMPFTRFVTGTTIGAKAVVVPLIIASAPYIARMVETSLKEVDNGVIEAARSMGASTSQIILKVLVAEAKPSLIMGGAISVITILSYSAMAGFVGGGGLGTIAINYGYYRYQLDIMTVTVILLVIIVQIFQEAGIRLMKHTDKRIH